MSLRIVFLKRLVNRSTTTSFPSINQVTKLAATHRPVVMQRKVPQIRTVLKTVELRRIPNPISQNLLMKDLRKWRNAPDTGAAHTGPDDKDPETAGPGLETAGLGASSAVRASWVSAFLVSSHSSGYCDSYSHSSAVVSLTVTPFGALPFRVQKKKRESFGWIIIGLPLSSFPQTLCVASLSRCRFLRAVLERTDVPMAECRSMPVRPLRRVKRLLYNATAGLRALSTEVQELRSALRRLASTVMWHDGAIVGSQQEANATDKWHYTIIGAPGHGPRTATTKNEDDDSVSRIHEGPEPVAAGNSRGGGDHSQGAHLGACARTDSRSTS